MSLKLITAPADDPVSLEEAKAHLRVDFTDDDSSIEIYLAAAIAAVQKVTGRVLIDQTWDLYLDEFPCRHNIHHLRRHHSRSRHNSAIEIPLPPLIEVQGVFYLDSTGTEQQFSASNYIVDTVHEPGSISLASGKAWPSSQCIANSVRVRFRAGYLDNSSPQVAAVPFGIKASILLFLGVLYANREQVVVNDTRVMAIELPWGADQLLAPYVVDFGIG